MQKTYQQIYSLENNLINNKNMNNLNKENELILLDKYNVYTTLFFNDFVDKSTRDITNI